MSIRVMERVWRHGPSHPAERLVLLCLADKAADDGRNAFPSMATIAERTALSQRTVERVIDRLVAAGYLLRERRYVGNGRRSRSNLYTIVLGRLEPNPVMVTGLAPFNTVTMTGLDDANTVTMTGSNTVTMTGSNTVTMTPYPSYIDPSYIDPSSAAAEPAAVIPAAAAAAGDNDSELRARLKKHGIDLNETTRSLARHNDDYIAAQVAYAEAHGEGLGLAIRRMLNDEALPSADNGRPRPPAELLARAEAGWNAILEGIRRFSNFREDELLATLDAPTRAALKTCGGLSRIRHMNVQYESGQVKRQFISEFQSAAARLATEADAGADSAWRRVADAVAQHGPTDAALEWIGSWDGGDPEKLVKIAYSFGLERVAQSHGNRDAAATRAAFLTYYRQAMTNGHVAAEDGGS